MTRRDAHLDAMLRHLGAAYYDSLQGRAANADVTRAVQQVASQLGEPSGQPETGARDGLPARTHHRRYHSRVQDIMTRSVRTVDRITPYKDIASLMATHHVGGVPVLELGRHVAGIVTEADLIAATGRRPASWRLLPRRPQGLIAEQLMTSPAITTHPDAPLAQLARTMADHRVGQLPVVDAAGVLVGIVSRRDLLKVFLRPDEDIARQIRELLASLFPASPGLTVSVKDGVVTLAGGPASQDELAALTRDVDGVVAVRAEH